MRGDISDMAAMEQHTSPCISSLLNAEAPLSHSGTLLQEFPCNRAPAHAYYTSYPIQGVSTLLDNGDPLPQ
ncbi:hypothetical protein Y032_0027g1541 [Ancylostoma ceylanicum]|uniref:Uncharacterized protein n=1 Tax=Ancylostoma ceylanicum TaxID=53326 RepID=A0A016UUK2_9BILA|nr:hypothetical protein Y032_0027g1541 [Ancylostoma ceylanicum]